MEDKNKKKDNKKKKTNKKKKKTNLAVRIVAFIMAILMLLSSLAGVLAFF